MPCVFSTNFRGPKSAAPLKRAWPCWRRWGSRPFPRPKIRGPIEAMPYHLKYNQADSHFRGPKSAAPLKQDFYRRAISRLLFPRPKIRGPIEASAFASNWRPRSYFRGPKSAAPLKHACVPDTFSNLRYFRGPKSAAPLKRGKNRGRQKKATPFPRPKIRGPIEARSGLDPCSACFHFRGPKSAAPLKRGLPLIYTRDLLFPRPKIRGPIEAPALQQRLADIPISAAQNPRPH